MTNEYPVTTETADAVLRRLAAAYQRGAISLAQFAGALEVVRVHRERHSMSGQGRGIVVGGEQIPAREIVK